MVGNEIFLKKGFEIIDTAPPDFDLLVIKFRKNTSTPKFKNDWNKKISIYKKGVTIIRADQCPYTKKNVNEIADTLIKTFGITPVIIENKNYKEAQGSPCASGSFCIIFNGEIISYPQLAINVL